MKRLISTGLAATALTPLAAGVAFGGSHFGSKLTMAYSRSGNGRFSGRVKSSHAACRTGRLVSIYEVRSGSDRKVGSDKSGHSGAWKYSPPSRVPTGDYYAATSSMRLGSGQGVCRPAQSVVTHVS